MRGHNELRGWRKKDVYRFRNADLVAVRYLTGLAESFLYHEAICDLVDVNRENRVKVSLLSLAAVVHDCPTGDFDGWESSRATILNLMRDRGLICFDGEVNAHRELEISLSPGTYGRWYDHPRRPKRDASGKFAKKPAHTEDHRTDPHGEKNSRTEPCGTVDLDLDLDLDKTTTAPRVRVREADHSERAIFVADVAAELSKVLDSPSTQLEAEAERLLFKAERTHPHSKRREPFAAWQAAVRKGVAAVRGGKEVDDLVGYIVGIVPGADAEPLKYLDGVVGIDKPPPPSTNSGRYKPFVPEDDEPLVLR